MILLTGLAGCQVRPMYAENSDLALKLASVSFSDATDRIGQEVRNKLIFIAGHGAGETLNPQYTVELRTTSSVANVLLVESSDSSRAGRATVSVDYVIRRSANSQLVKAGSRSATALVDFPSQEFAKARAIRDAETRAADEAAEMVGADIAAALSR